MPTWLIASALFTTIGQCAIQEPVLRQITPLALLPDRAIRLKISGGNIQHSTHLWLSCPTTVESLSLENESLASFPWNSSSVLREGYIAARLFGSDGASGIQWLLVDSLPTVTLTNSLERFSPFHLFFGSAVESSFVELKSAWYRLHLPEGRRIYLETLASRLGSSADPWIRWFDPNTGKILGFQEDASGKSGDVLAEFPSGPAREVEIELRDSAYGGGSTFAYRLRVSDLPWQGDGRWAHSGSMFSGSSDDSPPSGREVEPNADPTRATP